MSEREPIGKKLRFEIFKRDSFTCQYCGAAAPDVVLEIDHLKPVSIGGDNDLTNLITSCKGCNAGKGARELDDNSVVMKQRAQLEDLNERRLQLEMMMEWRTGLQGVKNAEIDLVAKAFEDKVGFTSAVNDNGRQHIKKWLRNFSLSEILDALDAAVIQYVEYEGEGEDRQPLKDSLEKAFLYIPRIANVARRPEHESRFYYIRGIMRNRFNYVDQLAAIKLMRRAYELGADIDWLQAIARESRNWSSWRSAISDFIIREERDTEE